jgi:hypothetical protein
MRNNYAFKVQQDFLPLIFSKRNSSQDSYSVFKDFPNFASNSMRYVRFLNDSSLLHIYSGESILPVLFIMESCDSLYRFSEESLFVRIICINSCLSFNTESWYLCIVYYGESLLPASFIAESHCSRRVIFKNIEGLALPLKGQ